MHTIAHIAQVCRLSKKKKGGGWGLGVGGWGGRVDRRVKETGKTVRRELSLLEWAWSELC